MSIELLYTSAPQGLKAGSRGFSTVLSTSGMPSNLAEKLESLSGYKHLYAPQDPRSANNPVRYSFVRSKVGGKTVSIISRVSDYGVDYSGRTNKLAHHVVVETHEQPQAGPGWLAKSGSIFRESWNGVCETLPTGPRIPLHDHQPAVCHLWEEVMGDAGWGGKLASELSSPTGNPIWIVFREDQSGLILSLVDETLRLLPPEARWRATFSTNYTSMPIDADCRIRGTLVGSEESRTAIVRGLVINLTKPGPLSESNPWIELARNGETALPAIISSSLSQRELENEETEPIESNTMDHQVGHEVEGDILPLDAHSFNTSPALKLAPPEVSRSAASPPIANRSQGSPPPAVPIKRSKKGTLESSPLRTPPSPIFVSLSSIAVTAVVVGALSFLLSGYQKVEAPPSKPLAPSLAHNVTIACSDSRASFTVENVVDNIEVSASTNPPLPMPPKVTINRPTATIDLPLSESPSNKIEIVIVLKRKGEAEGFQRFSLVLGQNVNSSTPTGIAPVPAPAPPVLPSNSELASPLQPNNDTKGSGDASSSAAMPTNDSRAGKATQDNLNSSNLSSGDSKAFSGEQPPGGVNGSKEKINKTRQPGLTKLEPTPGIGNNDQNRPAPASKEDGGDARNSERDTASLRTQPMKVRIETRIDDHIEGNFTASIDGIKDQKQFEMDDEVSWSFPVPSEMVKARVSIVSTAGPIKVKTENRGQEDFALLDLRDAGKPTVIGFCDATDLNLKKIIFKSSLPGKEGLRTIEVETNTILPKLLSDKNIEKKQFIEWLESSKPDFPDLTDQVDKIKEILDKFTGRSKDLNGIGNPYIAITSHLETMKNAFGSGCTQLRSDTQPMSPDDQKKKKEKLDRYHQFERDAIDRIAAAGQLRNEYSTQASKENFAIEIVFMTKKQSKESE